MARPSGKTHWRPCTYIMGRKLGKALSNWWELNFKSFQAHLKKLFKCDIPVSERDQWESYLTTERQKVETLTVKIHTLESILVSRGLILRKVKALEFGCRGNSKRLRILHYRDQPIL